MRLMLFALVVYSVSLSVLGSWKGLNVSLEVAHDAGSCEGRQGLLDTGFHGSWDLRVSNRWWFNCNH